jgi:hypothetical protein
MIHIFRRHPEIDRAANPIRQLRYSANILNPKNNNTIHDSSIVMADSLLRQYEEDRRDELIAKRQERERIYSRELIEDYHTILKVNDIENQKRMGGTFGSDANNEIFYLWIAGVITPVMTIDSEGTIRIRNELRNRGK